MTTYNRSQLPLIRPLTVTRGDTLVSAKRYHRNLDDSPRNLTGTTIEASGTFANGAAVTLTVERDDLAGWWKIVVPAETAALWPEGRGTYHVAITDTLGGRLTYVVGALMVKELPDV